MKFTLPRIAIIEEANVSYHGIWIYKLATIANLTQSIVGTSVVLWYWRSVPTKIPLWFSRPWGEERLTYPAFLLVPILVSIIVYVSNIWVANKYTLEHPLFTRVLFLSSALVSIMSLYIILRILSLIV
ncbi:MAG: hypothetical protein AAB492_01770 [Patescibacteria group bacterium]